jgi:hypothetical protein
MARLAEHGDGHLVTMRSFHELHLALEAVHVWTLMISDESQITPDAVGAMNLVMVTLARVVLGVELVLPANPDEVMERDELRMWFEREMGKN